MNCKSMRHLLAEVPHKEVQENMSNSLCQLRKNPRLMNFIRCGAVFLA